MHSYPQEFVLVCRQLGEAQQRCSATLAAQAARIDALQAEVVRLRGAVVLRDTQLAVAREELVRAHAAEPAGARRKAMARHIAALVERIGALSRECLRWRLAAESDAMAARPAASAPMPRPVPAQAAAPVEGEAGMRIPALTPAAGRAVMPILAPHGGTLEASADTWTAASLAAADLVICQTGCISHDAYWRVQDHCRRTGKPCILVDQSLAGCQAHGPAQGVAPPVPVVILRGARPLRAADAVDTGADVVCGRFFE